MKRVLLLGILSVASVLSLLVPVHATITGTRPNEGVCIVEQIPLVGAAATPGATLAQLTATASQSFYRTQLFDQNNSGIYGGSSTRATFPVNFSSYSEVSSVQGATMSFALAAYEGDSPQVNVTQGSTVIANGTADLPFTLSINATSGTAVTDRVVELFGAGDAVPSDGHYEVYTNASQLIQFTYTSSDSWIYNSTAYLANYSISAPSSYSLSAAQLFLPFPNGVDPDYTSVRIQENGISQKTFVVEPGGVLFDPATMAPGATVYIDAQVQPEPNLGGAAPMVDLRTYSSFNSSYFEANGTWFNSGQIAYAGQYVLTGNFPYEMDASTMNLYDGSGLLPRTDYSVSGDTITVLPLVLNTASDGVASFALYFQFIGAPPSLEIAKGSTWISAGALTVSWGDLLATLSVVAIFAVVVLWLFSPEARHNRRVFVVGLVAVIALAGAYVLLPPVGI